jgi:O-antigen/teichoic acid export membrane protein
LLVANFFLGLFYNFSIGFKLSDQTQWGSYLALFGAAITVAVNVVFIPTLGYFAPAWASLLCFGAMGVASYFVTQRLWPVPYSVGRMGYYLGLTLLAWGTSVYANAWLGLPQAGKLAFNTVLFVLVIVVLYRTEGRWLRGALKVS